MAVRLARGIEAGILGGIAMLLLWIVGSLLRGFVWWEMPNLMGSTFYGVRAFRSGVGAATVSGIALHMVVSGSLGILFTAAFWHLRSRRQMVLIGVLAGLAWYYVADAVFWSRVNRMVPLYAAQGTTLVAHALFGACLGLRLRVEQAAGVEDKVE